jgi:inorganic pyrophosphatase
MAFKNIKIGEKAPASLNVVIEIPRGSHNKYEYDEKLDEIMLDRVLHSPMFYPTDYGFIPETRSEDGDHLDVMVIVTDPTFPGCVMSVRPIGVLDMEDEAGVDWKIIAVANKDPRLMGINDIEDLDEHQRKEIKHFFEVYKDLEDKKVNVKGWSGKKEALRLIEQGMEKYSKEDHS